MKLRPTDIVTASTEAGAHGFTSRELALASARFGLTTTHTINILKPTRTAMVLGTAVEPWSDYRGQQLLALVKVMTMDGHVLWMAAAALKLVARRKQ